MLVVRGRGIRVLVFSVLLRFCIGRFDWGIAFWRGGKMIVG